MDRVGSVQRNGIVLISVLALLAAHAGAAMTFLVTPDPALMDERITVRLTGLAPGRTVTIRAASRDQRGRMWRSSAVFAAGTDGSLDLSRAPSISGTYRGLDAMGLFWSMQPDRSVQPVPSFFAASRWSEPIVTELDAVVDGVVAGNARLVRRFAMPGVRSEPFRSEGVVGILYRPGDDLRHTVVVLLGGSEGGFPEPEGPMLASRGFIVLALAYFGAEGLPGAMQKIPVEYFGKAIRAIQRLPRNEGAPIFVLGASRGGEAALLIGSTFPEVNGVIGVSASHVRWEGATARLLPGGPAWTYADKPLPYLRFRIGPTFAVRYVWASVTHGALSLSPMFLDSLARAKTGEGEIPVERIRGPVLLGAGADDRKWPSGIMSKRAIERLQRKGHSYPDELYVYEGAGHWLPAAYLPTGGLLGNMAQEIGGTPWGTAAVQREWWPRVLRFLSSRGVPLNSHQPDPKAETRGRTGRILSNARQHTGTVRTYPF